MTIHTIDLEPFSVFVEAKLVRELADGDVTAFSRMYEHYQPKLFHFVYPLTRFSRQDTEEILQDIFLKLWLRKETLPAVKSLQAYLFTMAKNRLHDLRHEAASHGVHADLDDSHSSVEDEILLNEYHTIARRAIDLLPAQKRRIYTLRNEFGLSLDEIAQQLQITKFAVKKQLYDALRAIKAYLKDHAGIDMPVLVLLIIYRL